MIHVKVTKLESFPDRPDGMFEGSDGKDYIHGSITEGYSIRGYTKETPTIGKPFIVDRYERNGVKALGQFSTSPIVAFDTKTAHIEIRTVNSIYRIDLLNP